MQSARVVDQKIDPSEALHRPGRHVLDLLGVPNVDLNRERRAPVSAPMSSTSAATEKMEPGSFSLDSVLFPTTTTLHPAFARPSAIARPIPRVEPVTMATLPRNAGTMDSLMGERASARF